MPKPDRKTQLIRIACTPAQKNALKAKAKEGKARSLSEYLLTLGLEGRTEEFGFMRRKAEGALVNAMTYARLTEMLQVLQSHSGDTALVSEAIALLEEVRREIVLARLTQRVEEVLEL